uniref:Exonuclease domain-containing protein n=1 Tax=Magallana gigas TaxID=29159 RepID=A0A8W8I6I6_MAGGI
MANESQKAFRDEMREVAAQEMDSNADSFDKELGVAIIEDEFKGDPSLIEKCNSGAFDLLTESNSSSPQPPAKTMPVEKHVGVLNRPASTKTKKKIIFPSKARSGMTVAADHAWQKRGYDSLTGHTFLISKRNKVLKTVIKHRSCATCKWWKRNRPGQRIRSHRCVWNHNGSARMTESEAGLLALKEMSSQDISWTLLKRGGNEAIEGLSYQSEIGLSVKEEDIEKIPDPVPKPSFSSSSNLKNCSAPSVVILDLETTGLIQHGIMPHITQIAAVNSNTKEQFSRYVAPDLPITPMAEKVTNITWSGGVLCYRGEPVDFVRIKTALVDFLEWLEKFPTVVIVAHNGRTFDFRVLCNAFRSCGLQDRFCSKVSAFCDSLTLFRQKFPKLEKYKQEFLAQHFCGHTYNAHNALDDVIMLDEIMQAALLSVSDFKKHSYNTECQFLQEEFNSYIFILLLRVFMDLRYYSALSGVNVPVDIFFSLISPQLTSMVIWTTIDIFTGGVPKHASEMNGVRLTNTAQSLFMGTGCTHIP